MCGILGITTAEHYSRSKRRIIEAVKCLYLLSESRGREASGVAVASENAIQVIKSPLPASRMVKTTAFQNCLLKSCHNDDGAVSIIGQSRLVTTGTQFDNRNNQPVVAAGTVGIHNGIVVNMEALYQKHSELHREYDVDTELLVRLLRKHLDRTGSPQETLRLTFSEIDGMASLAVLFDEYDMLLLATNNGSLYYSWHPEKGIHVFASEHSILTRFIERYGHENGLDEASIRQLEPGTGCMLGFKPWNLELLSTHKPFTGLPVAKRSRPRNTSETDPVLTDTHVNTVQRSIGMNNWLDDKSQREVERIKKMFPCSTVWSDSLKRCTRCILPETMPFIAFDQDGVCNYCRSYTPLVFKGENALRTALEKARRPGNMPDCVIGVSGGRDSLFALHYLKKVLKVRPVAYTYDWGMVTDLARRNISRICGRLGVEHIVVSADIIRKRQYIRSNVTAWLKKPALSTIPLFMAGDKHFYHYLRKVRQETGAGLAFLGENRLERTDFKTGFAGVSPYRDKSHHVYTLSLHGKLKLALHYAMACLKNPRYFNASVLDSISGFASYYLIPRDFYNLYAYVPWVENTVVKTLREQYDFELSPDCTTTWRIGDGTAAFYNLIYFTVAGFSEHDTFRSNQIREGMLTRDEALRLVKEENIPRYETIYWYLNIIGLGQDIETVFRIIKGIPRIEAAGTSQVPNKP